MKIAFVCQPIDYIGPQASGSSIGIWTDRVIRELASPENTFTIYAKHFPDQPPSEQAGAVRYQRFSTLTDERLGKPFKLAERLLNYPLPKRPFFASELSSRLFARQVAQDLRQNPADVIHIHNFSQLVPTIRKANPQAKIVMHMHCEWLSQLDHRLIEGRLAMVDLVVGCSDYITGKIRERFPQYAAKCKTVYNGVNLEQFSPDPAAPVEGRDKQILFVGRVSPEKGLHVLIEAFSKAAAQIPDLHLKIVGSVGNAPYEYIALVGGDDPLTAGLGAFYHGFSKRGDYYADLQALIPAHLKEQVFFTGMLPHEKVTPFYHEAAALVNPSLSEAFGMSLVEAMATGVPVIATRVGGMVEITNGGQTGLLVEPNDPDALAQALVEVVCEPDLRKSLGEAGYQRVGRYSWKQVASTLWALYQQL